jgi:hypothetical protein
MKDPEHFMLLWTVPRLGEPGDIKTKQEVFEYMTCPESKKFSGSRQTFMAIVYPGERLAVVKSKGRDASIGIGWQNSHCDPKYCVAVIILGSSEKVFRKVLKIPEAPKYLDSKNHTTKTIAILSLSGKITQVRELMGAIYGPILKKKKKSSFSAL